MGLCQRHPRSFHRENPNCPPRPRGTPRQGEFGFRSYPTVRAVTSSPDTPPLPLVLMIFLYSDFILDSDLDLSAYSSISGTILDLFLCIASLTFIGLDLLDLKSVRKH